MTATAIPTTSPTTSLAPGWHPVCRLDDLLTGRGACALLDGHQIALFLLWDGTVRAVANYDPRGGAHVISRGLVGTRGDVPIVASPLYKHAYDLRTGHCLDDPDGPALTTYPTRVHAGHVEIRLPAADQGGT
jgi:nitrite reductase (NADH) small subunit